MYKLLLFATFLALLITLLPDHSLRAQNFQGFVSVGVNGSQIDNDEIAGFNQGGLLLGGGVNFQFDENMMVGTRLFFSQKGSRSTDKDPFFLRYRLNFIEVPFLFRYQVYDQVWLEAGISANYLFFAEAELNGSVASQIDLLNTFDWCAVGGVSYQINDKWSARLHFNSSLLTMRQDQAFFNRTLSLAIGYTLYAD